MYSLRKRQSYTESFLSEVRQRYSGVFFFIAFTLTILGGAALLTLDIWPGLVADVLFDFPFLLLSLPVFGSWFLLLVGLGLRDLKVGSQSENRRRWGIWSAAVMFVTLALLWLNVPQRIAFAFWSLELEPLIGQVPTGTHFDANQQEIIRVGPYRVDAYATDERGGVYFRTHTGPDGLGPDRMSYGFAFRPNREGSPFGNDDYHHRYLFGDWYAFAASNDW
jgi:hypothetical protein